MRNECEARYPCCSRLSIVAGDGTGYGPVHRPFHGALVLSLAGNVSEH